MCATLFSRRRYYIPCHFSPSAMALLLQATAVPLCPSSAAFFGFMVSALPMLLPCSCALAHACQGWAPSRAAHCPRVACCGAARVGCSLHWPLAAAACLPLPPPGSCSPPPHPLALPPTSWQGVTSALVFANLGASYGTAKSSVGIVSMGIMHPTEVGGCAAQRGAPSHCARHSLTPPRAHCALPTPLALPR